MMSIAITGASGFVGSFISKLDGYSKVSMGRVESIDNCSGFVPLDLADNSFDVTKYLMNIDCVIHCAGLAHGTRGDFRTINSDATIRLARQAGRSGVKKFIFISSIARFGIQTGIIDKCSRSTPLDDYGVSKKEAEEGLQKIQLETSMEIISIQAPLLYGPGAPGNFSLLRKLVRLLPVNPFSSIQNQRSVLSIYNLVDFVRYVIEKNVPSGSYLVADPDVISTHDLMQCIADSSGFKRIGVPVPASLWRLIFMLFFKSSLFTKVFGDLVVDTSETSLITGWCPTLTTRESISKTVHEEY